MGVFAKQKKHFGAKSYSSTSEYWNKVSPKFDGWFLKILLLKNDYILLILVFENDSRVNIYSVAGTEAVLVVFQNQTNQYYKTFF